jgi:hypothetical protein
MDSAEAVAIGVDDLRRRLEAAGRDPEGVDVCFSAPAAGSPGELLAALEALARLGVTWVQVPVPGNSVDHAVEALWRYGDEVIAQLR